MSRAVFLDKDGTLVRDVPYNAAPGVLELAPSAGEGLRLLAGAGYKLIVVSNQSGLARGYFTLPQLWDAVTELVRQLDDAGVRLDGFYFCPHHADGTVDGYALACGCRKPRPGMLLRAAREHDVDLGESWMVGDILDDVEAGRRAGCRTVLLDNGGETLWETSALREPHHIAVDLQGAARHILGEAPARRLPQGQPAQATRAATPKAVAAARGRRNRQE